MKTMSSAGEIKIKLSGLNRVMKKGYVFHVLAYTIVIENAVKIEPAQDQIDAWVAVKQNVKPLIEKLLERGLLHSSEVRMP